MENMARFTAKYEISSWQTAARKLAKSEGAAQTIYREQ